MPGLARRAAIATGALLGLVLALLIAAQLILPGIASSRLRTALAAHGSDVHVAVSAFPAVELLFHHADKVVVDIGSLQASQGRAGNLVAEIRDAGSLDATIASFDDDGLTLHDLHVTLKGDVLRAGATITQKAIDARLPFNLKLSPSHDGIVLQEHEGLIGSHDLSEQIMVSKGAIVIEPHLTGLAGLANGLVHLKVFSNPVLTVDSVSSTRHGDAYEVSAVGRYT